MGLHNVIVYPRLDLRFRGAAVLHSTKSCQSADHHARLVASIPDKLIPELLPSRLASYNRDPAGIKRKPARPTFWYRANITALVQIVCSGNQVWLKY